jgi:prepilin-type N-terminal cleavage/methylation domain-containing protein
MERKKGFTLIELLVVVLIIGILAAVALPQYNKAVLKSRAYATTSNLKIIAEANKRYKMMMGNYTTNIDDLDVTITPDKYFQYVIESSGSVMSVNAFPLFGLSGVYGSGWRIMLYGEYKALPQIENKFLCMAIKEGFNEASAEGATKCKIIGSNFQPAPFSPNIYVISYL